MPVRPVAAPELGGLKLSALRQRAEAAGLGSAAIEDATDQDDPKAALIQLLGTATATTLGATTRATETHSATEKIMVVS